MKKSIMKELGQRQHPKCCKHVFRNLDSWLMCDLSEGEHDYLRNKCVDGFGRCDRRINRWR